MPDPMSPFIDDYDCAVVQVRLELPEELDQARSERGGKDVMCAHLDDAWPRTLGQCEHRSEIKVMGQNYALPVTRPRQYVGVRSAWVANLGPMDRIPSRVCEDCNPGGRHVHVQDKLHRGLSRQLGFFGAPCGIGERGANVLGFEVGIRGEDLGFAVPRCEQAYDRANGHPKATDARLSPHDPSVERNSLHRLHLNLLLSPILSEV